MATNHRTIQWACGHSDQEAAGNFPAQTIQRQAACLKCRNAELQRLHADLPAAVLVRQPREQDGDQNGLFRAPVYPVRSGACGMCGRSLSSGGHPSAGVCDNV